jgi:parallel beta-helix repeat protein
MRLFALRRFFPGILLALSLPAAAATYYVSPSGNDANDGRDLTRPFRTVQRGANAAVAGDTVYVRAGTFRETVTFTNKNGTATAPIVLSAYGSERPILKGSQVVTGWTLHSGAIWKRTSWTINSQQVFDDGVVLKQIGMPSSYFTGTDPSGQVTYTPVGTGLSSMTAGSFFYDPVSRTLYAWLSDSSNPANSMIEVSTARRVMQMTSNSSNIHVKNMTFRHSASAAFEQTGVAVEIGTGCRLEGCDVQWCDFAGVGFGYGHSNAQVINCTVANNGNSGLQGSGHNNFLVSGCDIYGNNYRKFNAMWHAGGMKFTTDCYGVIEKSQIHDNIGVGAWFDYCDSGNLFTVRANRIYNNVGTAGNGIMTEGSKNGLLMNNVISGQEKMGIYVSASDDIRVYNNTVTGTRGVAAISVSGMPRTGKTLSNIQVHNNILSNNVGTNDLYIIKENGSDIWNIACDFNCIYRSSGAVALWWGADSRGGFSGKLFSTVGTWNMGTPFDDHSLQADPQYVVGSGADFAVKATSPAVNAGALLSAVVNDYLSAARPLQGNHDLGAFEYSGTATANTLRVRVNFQPTASPVPLGYLKDDGAAFAARNGYTYGWLNANANARDREAATSPDQRYDTFNYLQINGVNNTWEMAVPNGNYRVYVVCGDSSYFTGTYALNVEGIPTIKGTPSIDMPWLDGTAVVAINDGKLTLANGLGSNATKLCFVQITATTDPVSAPSIGPFSARINFQPGSSAAYTGYVIDDGSAYGMRGSYTFGWSSPNVNSRDRNSTKSADQRFDTFNYLSMNSSVWSWELAVPNGTYRVRLVCGDPSYASGVFKVNAEGVLAVSGTPTTSAPWIDGTVVVTVSDGRLTLTNASGSVNNKLCFIDVDGL